MLGFPVLSGLGVFNGTTVVQMTKEELSNLIDGLDRDVFRIVSELSEAVSDTAWVAEIAALISATIHWRCAK